MGKAKVSKELYEALNRVIENHGKEWFLNTCIEKKYSGSKWKCIHYKIFDDLDIKYVVDLILNGYELEVTKEEVLVDLYKGALNGMKSDSSYSFNDGYRRGIESAVQILGIQIEGINK